jgi:hypothetical protein
LAFSECDEGLEEGEAVLAAVIMGSGKNCGRLRDLVLSIWGVGEVGIPVPVVVGVAAPPLTPPPPTPHCVNVPVRIRTGEKSNPSEQELYVPARAGQPDFRRLMPPSTAGRLPARAVPDGRLHAENGTSTSDDGEAKSGSCQAHNTARRGRRGPRVTDGAQRHQLRRQQTHLESETSGEGRPRSLPPRCPDL